jgi:hypothetical protein
MSSKFDNTAQHFSNTSTEHYAGRRGLFPFPRSRSRALMLLRRRVESRADARGVPAAAGERRDLSEEAGRGGLDVPTVHGRKNGNLKFSLIINNENNNKIA